jgi:DNA-binding Lrp family transcriptional regulator
MMDVQMVKGFGQSNVNHLNCNVVHE